MKTKALLKSCVLLFLSASSTSLLLSGCWGWSSCGSDHYDRCYPFGCYDEHNHDHESDAYEGPLSSFDSPAYDPSSSGITTVNWFLAFTDNTKAHPNHELLVKGVSGEFVRNKEGKGGKLLIDIDASKASFSCGVKLELLRDNNVSLLADVRPVAHTEAFSPESLNSSCLGGEKGARQGLAVYELENEPTSLRLNAFQFNESESEVSPSKISFTGSQIEVRLHPFEALVTVTIFGSPLDPTPLRPLIFEAAITGLPIMGDTSSQFGVLEFEETVLNLETSTTMAGEEMTYDLRIKNRELLNFMNLNNLNIFSARELR